MCYSVQVPTDKEMTRLPIEFHRDKASWVHLRELQDWEKRVTADDLKTTLGLARKPRASQFQVGQPGDRIYPKYFAPVIVSEGGRIWQRPLRYALRPSWSPQELASRYCLYNARLDRLLEARTWRQLIGRQHAVLPFASFYEWVSGPGGKKVQIQFVPEGKPLIWAPALWDRWSSLDGTVTFDSCAIITDDPPPEVLEAGHDRCPIFLAAEVLETWLDAGSKSPAEWQQFLAGHREEVYYQHRKAA